MKSYTGKSVNGVPFDQDGNVIVSAVGGTSGTSGINGTNGSGGGTGSSGTSGVDGTSGTSVLGTIKSVVVQFSWSTNWGVVSSTSLASGKTLISVTPYLICATGNNGYSTGDIASISATQQNDTGGLSDSGVGVRFVANQSDRFTLMVNDRIDVSSVINGSIGTNGTIGQPFSASTSQWDMYVIILYAD